MRLGVVGPESDGGAELGDRPVVVVLDVAQDLAEVDVGVGVRRAGVGWRCGTRRPPPPSPPGAAARRRDCSGSLASSGRSRMAVPIRGDRLRRLPPELQGGAEIEVSRRVIGPESDGGAELGDRLRQLPPNLQGDAEIDVGVRVIGPEVDGGAERGDRLVVVVSPASIQDRAEVDVGGRRRRAGGGWRCGTRRPPPPASPGSSGRSRGRSGHSASSGRRRRVSRRIATAFSRAAADPGRSPRSWSSRP